MQGGQQRATLRGNSNIGVENELVAVAVFSQAGFLDSPVGVGIVFGVVDFPRDDYAGVHVDDQVRLIELAGDGAGQRGGCTTHEGRLGVISV